MSSKSKALVPVWLDCDPGHDDAFAILLAAYSEEIEFLGISVVHGNDNVEHCAKNAERFLWTCGIKGIPVYIGVDRPLVREAKHCPEIHGTPGEQGVSGMCGYHFPDDIIFANSKYQPKEVNAVLRMVERVTEYSTSKVTIVATGAHTNIALAIRLFPQFVANIEKIVFMGGAIGIGNTGVAAEFNIEIDPEATHIILHSGVPIVMVPLEVTHTVLVTDVILEKIRKIGDHIPNLHTTLAQSDDLNHPHLEYENIFGRLNDKKTRINESVTPNLVNESKSISTPFSNCCFQLLTFFKSTYEKVFSFKYPPLHDPCAVFYVINPEQFETSLMFVDVELSSSKCTGRTLCDIHGILKQQPNVQVCTRMNVDAFWNQMLTCVQMANKCSPLNNYK